MGVKKPSDLATRGPVGGLFFVHFSIIPKVIEGACGWQASEALSIDGVFGWALRASPTSTQLQRRRVYLFCVSVTYIYIVIHELIV